MGPLEVYYGTIALIVTLIGLARGYSRELGSTMIILVAIFLLLFVENRLNPVLLTTRSLLLNEEAISETLFLSLIYQISFVAAVFAGYAGKTITFRGKEIPPPQGTFLSIVVGALNGYLIAGTLWYYQHAYGYPFSTLGWFNPFLTDTAQVLIRLIPQYLLPSATLWMIPIAVLLLLRVRG
jgi:uncharacterized membrane protein required for colicin V production